MRRFTALVGLACLAMVPAARAEPPGHSLRLSYSTYADGFTTLQLTAALDLGPDGYRLSLDYHTVGLVGFLFPGHAAVTADGLWHGTGAEPEMFQSQGLWSSRPYSVLMDYANGAPEVRRLTPPQTNQREPVPASLQRDTIDTVSAMALLLHRMADRGTCGLTVRIFDGRRLMAMASRPVGTDTLGVTTRSFFHGAAIRCDLTGQVLAGFMRSDGPRERQHVQKGAVWFAHPVAGLPLLPVRIAFRTRWFGTAMMYLTDVRMGPLGAGVAPSRLAMAPAEQAARGVPAAR
jgi:Protein of unknown function (DUF3108)